MATRTERKEIGLAVIGCGIIGRIRARIARDYPGVGWLGLCDIDEARAKQLADDTGADYYTTDYKELLARPEITAAIIATDEPNHAAPTLMAVEHGHDMLIEKPLATDVHESLEIHQAIQESGVDAVIGYTQRFRRRYLTVKERVRNGQIGEVSSVITRALLNSMAPMAGLQRLRPNQRRVYTPMVVNGTHTVDISMWLMEGKEPVEVYARSADKVLGDAGVKDSTFAIVTMNDGTIWSMNVSIGMPEVWPGAVYGLNMAIIGTKGAITIDDSHSDVVLASQLPQGPSYSPPGFEPGGTRNVEFLTSYPPGDIAFGQLWGPMREET
ncbi:MAG: Gfo/Idh/MocA family oxidoreductase, partial [Dehalococcoidia bacterium]